MVARYPSYSNAARGAAEHTTTHAYARRNGHSLIRVNDKVDEPVKYGNESWCESGMCVTLLDTELGRLPSLALTWWGRLHTPDWAVIVLPKKIFAGKIGIRRA